MRKSYYIRQKRNRSSQLVVNYVLDQVDELVNGLR
jgi:hypothetical protein